MDVVNRSGVVITKDGKRLYGFDAELHKKMELKEDPEWDSKVIAWIERVLGEKLPSDDLWACLKNGVVLIRLLNTLKPGLVPKYNKTRLVPLMEMDNIHLALQGFWSLGVPSDVMFTSTELYKRQDMSKVQRCLEALSKIATRFDCAVPPIDSTQKAPPKKIALVDDGGARANEAAVDPAEVRAKVAAVKAACEALEADEVKMRQQIADAKRSWRDEKTQLVYAVSNAEKEMRKQSVAGRAVTRVDSIRHISEMREHVDTARKEAEAALARELDAKKDVDRRLAEVLREEQSLVAQLQALEGSLAEMDAAAADAAKVAASAAAAAEASRGAAAAAAAPETPAPAQKYTQLAGDYYFYESAVTSPDMIAYLTAQLQKLLVNELVPFEDLVKLRQLFETDEGRRVFCFILFQMLRQTKRDGAAGAKRARHHILSAESFDLVLWLVITTLQCQVKFDFFGARVLMKASYYLAREVGPAIPAKSPRSPRLSRAAAVPVETIQQFIRSDPLWRNLAFWQELYYGDLNRKLKKKFSLSLGEGAALSSRERAFVVKFTSTMLATMRDDWGLANALQESLVLSVADQVGLTVADRDKLLREIGQPSAGATGGAASGESSSKKVALPPAQQLTMRASHKKTPSAVAASGSASGAVPLPPSEKQQEIMALTLRQKREVFGAVLRPRRGGAAIVSLFSNPAAAESESAQRGSFDPAEAQQLVPAPIWDVVRILETEERCLAAPGIFRQSPGAEELQLLRVKLEADEPVDWARVDAHDIAGLFKLWLRELPEPLTTFDAYPIAASAVDLTGEAQMTFMRRLVRRMPDANRIVLKKVLLVLQLYASRCEQNKMNLSNLAVVFAPALFRQKKQADLQAVKDATKFVSLVSFLVEHVDELL